MQKWSDGGGDTGNAIRAGELSPGGCAGRDRRYRETHGKFGATCGSVAERYRPAETCDRAGGIEEFHTLAVGLGGESRAEDLIADLLRHPWTVIGD